MASLFDVTIRVKDCMLTLHLFFQYRGFLREGGGDFVPPLEKVLPPSPSVSVSKLSLENFELKNLIKYM